MNRALLLLALAAAIPARAADKEFKPIKASESVTYPLPPIPLPAVQPADGKWAETEDSPALRVSRAWVKLGQAAGVERSELSRQILHMHSGATVDVRRIFVRQHSDIHKSCSDAMTFPSHRKPTPKL